MKRKRKICEECRFFFHGTGRKKKKYAFCMNTDLHGDSKFYEMVAVANPKNCPEDKFFEKEYGEDIFDECPFRAEYFMEEWNNRKEEH